MQRGRERRDDFFGMADPFGNFGGFGMRPSLYGGRDPFDDPFFTRPFRSMFQSSNSSTSDVSQTNGAKGIVIEELNSDDESEKEKETDTGLENEPSVEHPDDGFDEEKSKTVNHGSDYNRIEGTKSQARSFSFQTCKVTYGGVDGAYYTSTRTRRAGNDGVIVEESKEADKTTGQATHRISRGIHDKGHSVTRKLTSDGKVDTMQTLHNLNEDELAGFEEAWKGNGKRQLPDRSDQFDMHGTAGSSNSKQKGMATWGGWALPSAEQSHITEPTSAGRTKKVVRINID